MTEKDKFEKDLLLFYKILRYKGFYIIAKYISDIMTNYKICPLKVRITEVLKNSKYVNRKTIVKNIINLSFRAKALQMVRVSDELSAVARWLKRREF